MLGNTEKKRLLKLAEKIKKIPTRQFDLGLIAKKRECGTVCCAIGYCPIVFPRNFKYVDEYGDGELEVQLKGTNDVNFDAAEKFFGLTNDEAYFLFMPTKYETGARTPAKVVARRIENFANGVVSLEDVSAFEGEEYEEYDD